MEIKRKPLEPGSVASSQLTQSASTLSAPMTTQQTSLTCRSLGAVLTRDRHTDADRGRERERDRKKMSETEKNKERLEKNIENRGICRGRNM